MYLVDYHAEVHATWKLGELFNSLELSEENVLNLEKAANSSILEILEHDAFVHSLGRVTKFLRTTPQAQLMARDALIANRLKDTINGKNTYSFFLCFLNYFIDFCKNIPYCGIGPVIPNICVPKCHPNPTHYPCSCKETTCNKTSPYSNIGGCCNNIGNKLWGRSIQTKSVNLKLNFRYTTNCSS